MEINTSLLSKTDKLTHNTFTYFWNIVYIQYITVSIQSLMIKLGSSAKTKQENKSRKTQSHSCVPFASLPLLPLFLWMPTFTENFSEAHWIMAEGHTFFRDLFIGSQLLFRTQSLNNFPRSGLQQILFKDSLRLKKVYFSR